MRILSSASEGLLQSLTLNPEYYKAFAEKDVTEDMKAPVLRVVVFPSTPTEVHAGGMKWASSVEHVVIRDADRNRIVQQTREEPFGEEAQNAFGAKVNLDGVNAEFPLDQVIDMRSSKEEFFVSVIGRDKIHKDFKVKSKHLSQLP